MRLARNGVRIASLIVGLVLGTAAQAAAAGKPDCRAIEITGDRLACYDAAFPPKARQPALVENNAARPAYKDPFLAEEARTTARLKTICRGC